MRLGVALFAAVLFATHYDVTARPHNDTIRKITPAGVVRTLAGTAGQSGSIDGSIINGVSTTRFSTPFGVATDSAGNAYVADTYNNTIRKITSSGVVSTLAGMAEQSGWNDGSGSTARFNSPIGVATDSTGNVYVADTDNQLIRKITPAGEVITLAGVVGQSGWNDGNGSIARLYSPNGITTDSMGNVYVADTSNDTIRKITPAGLVSTLAGTSGKCGSRDGIGSNALFCRPGSVATDSAGNVYVADTYNNTIRKITPAGAVSTLAGAAAQFGSTDGNGRAARFNSPYGVATDSAGNVYVADYGNSTIRRIDATGSVITLAGSPEQIGSVDGAGGAARFNSPLAVATDLAGNVYVADYGNSTIRKVTPAGVVTTLAGIAGQVGSSGAADGTAQLKFPNCIATDLASR